MYFFPTLVIDNFFKEPFKVREYALSLEYEKSKNRNFSGERTKDLFEINEFLANEICSKVLTSCGIPFKRFEAKIYFHLTGEEFGSSGWPHADFSRQTLSNIFASVIYLNPQVKGLESGTSIFRFKNLSPIGESIEEMKESFRMGEDNLEAKLNYLNNFEENIRIGAAFNRIVCYDARNLHCGNEYFGLTKDDKRLTVVIFFDKIETLLPENYTPIVYADMRSAI